MEFVRSTDLPVVIREHEFSVISFIGSLVWFCEQWGGCLHISRARTLIHRCYEDVGDNSIRG